MATTLPRGTDILSSGYFHFWLASLYVTGFTRCHVYALCLNYQFTKLSWFLQPGVVSFPFWIYSAVHLCHGRAAFHILDKPISWLPNLSRLCFYIHSIHRSVKMDTIGWLCGNTFRHVPFYILPSSKIETIRQRQSPLPDVGSSSYSWLPGLHR